MTDVAFLAELDESTVYRLWDDPRWLDRIKGKSLQAIIGVLPGVADYVARYTLANRRSNLRQELESVGLQLNMPAMKHLVLDELVPEQYLSNALSVAVSIVQNNPRQAASHLVRFWGREQDYALGFLFKKTQDSGLLVDSRPLIDASISLIERLGKHQNSFHAMVAQANLLHYIAQTTGRILVDIPSNGLERSSAIAYRSSMIGLILQTNDRGIAESYDHTLINNPVLSLIEEWAFPTYTHDTRVTSDFTLPRSLLLRNTTSEIIREVEIYNDAYLYYLVKTAIPTLARKDPTFGLRVAELKTRIQARMDSCEDSITRRECESIIKKLANDPTDQIGDFVAEQW